MQHEPKQQAPDDELLATKAAGKSEVLEEIPEHVPGLAPAFQAEIRPAPELFPKQRRHEAIARQDQGREAGRQRRPGSPGT